MAKKTDTPKPPALFDPVANKLTAIGHAAQVQHSLQSVPEYKPIKTNEDITLAIAIADTHLSTNPPTLHADDVNWFEHIERNFDWLFSQAQEYNVPILIAGDIFDKAVNDSKLLSFTISLLSRSPQPIYTVAGNHDLPFHSIDKIEDSGYAVLMKSGVIIDCSEPQTYFRNNTSVQVHGYHWLKPFSSIIHQNSESVQIALVHRMITDGKAGWYPGCEQHTVDAVIKQFKPYFHYAIFGDNHTPFVTCYNAREGKVHVINPGSYLRRNRGDLELAPRAYLIQTRGATKAEVPKAIATAGETRGTVDTRESTEGDPDCTLVASFAQLPSFLSDSSDETYIAPDIESQYRRYISTLHAPDEVHKKLEGITGITSH
jgi:UDP-2,3-diacylglucosamine pyrophosphatase LpxH